jgi:hypothetical protein
LGSFVFKDFVIPLLWPVAVTFDLDVVQIGLRGLLALMRCAGEGYWGLLPEQALQLHTQQQQQNIDQSTNDENNQPSSETAGAGRSWVHSMFSRDKNALNQTSGSGRSRGNQPVLGMFLVFFPLFPFLA